MKDWEEIKKRLDAVSGSFCLAKWLQVTVDLHNGLTQSCHHPKRHRIPLGEIQENPDALHNTRYKMEQRKKMLDSVRPQECSYCWGIEDANQENLSDRHIKSSDEWAAPYFENISKSAPEERVKPTYLEVMFSNTCNLSCSYCMASVSSSIEKEVKEFGPFPMPSPGHRMSDENEEITPEEREKYIKAFWQWFPQIYEGLHVLRVTGGEPLLDKNLFALMDYIEANPNSKLSFAVNSNFSLPPALVERFLKASKPLVKKIKEMELYLSLDAVSEQASFIRSGLNFSRFNQNIEMLKEMENPPHLVIMCTYSIFSMEGFESYLEYILKLKKDIGNVSLDIAYLRDPHYLSPQLGLEKQRENLKRSIEYMEKNASDDLSGGFSDYETKKLKRIWHFINVPRDQKYTEDQLINFYYFVNEYSKRKRTEFHKIFHELQDVYNLARKTVFLRKVFEDDASLF